MVSDTHPRKNETVLKFLCSYGGKISPRSSDGRLRYVGGFTRILSVDRSISYTELMVKLMEFCGFSVELKCQLPDGDLETLITIKSDDELRNLIEEYEISRPGAKIRAVLSPPKSIKTISPPLSTRSSIDLSPSSKMHSNDSYNRSPMSYSPVCGYPVGVVRDSGKVRYNRGYGQENYRQSCFDLRCKGNWH